ncbi:MAG: AsmA family protein [Terracidiphilus sp.]
MTDGARNQEKRHRRLWAALAVIAFFLLVLIVPPLISVNHYKGEITQLMARSLGRPVRLSSVEARLLPWPGFVLTDLSVAEDPAYGAEPVLHANKVRASLRLLALWRGRMEIDKISVDEASLNLVRAAQGKWNLDPLFRTATAQSGVGSGGASDGGARVLRLPSLVATNSRIDFKNGAEKLPFSIVNADLSIWQASPGEWRIRLRGEPARTDVSLYQEETGVVRMEASVRSAAALAEMPLHVYVNWREAQLGQLARLVTGSDPGWRGDLTGELHVDGTADAAQIAMRLRATNVQRAEFAPATPLDFDANCGFLYHYNRRSFENLDCNSPLGDGHMRLTGEKTSEETASRLIVELDRIPIAAGLDALRTLRSGLDPDLEANGTVSGKLVYDRSTDRAAEPAKIGKATRRVPSAAVEPTGPLSGSLTVADFALTGGGLSKPVQAAKIVLAPTAAAPSLEEALTGSFAIPAGGDAPLVFNMRFSVAGYEVGVRGPAAIVRARELAHAAGVAEVQSLASLAGDPLTVDLTAAGPWVPQEENPAAVTSAEAAPAPPGQNTAAAMPSGDGAIPIADSLTGTVTLHNANWKADYLANHIEIAEATLHLDGLNLRWDPVVFTYGAIKGTTALSRPLRCPAAAGAGPQPCPVQFKLQFDDLDASTFESALLGAQQKTTLLSSLIDRLHPASSPPWPALEGTVKTDSLVLGPVTLRGVSAEVKVQSTGAEISSFDAGLFGGNVHLTGSLVKPANDQDKPAYTFEGDFQKVNAGPLGALLGLRWTGAALNGNGKVELAGYTGKDLAGSAQGLLHFECRRGSVGIQSSKLAKAEAVPAALGRFEQWTADATIANSGVTLNQNSVTAGGRKQTVAATVKFGDPPVVSFAPAKAAVQKQ